MSSDSINKQKGFHDGLKGKKRNEPHDFFDLVFSGHENHKRKAKENDAYFKGHAEGKRYREKK
jgi:hypothetical protein